MNPYHSYIRTTTGDIAPSDLGFCHGHEHTYLRPGPSCQVNSALRLDDIERSSLELKSFYVAGGRAVTDCQPIGIERSPSVMRQLSQASEVKIIAATGFHRPCFYPEGHFLHTESVETLAQRVIDEIQTGMWDYDGYGIQQGAVQLSDGSQTDIRAGLIKFTSEYHFLPELSRKAAEAACIAHEETHAPIITHTELGTFGLEQVDFAAAHGVKPQSLVLSHLDRNPDRFLHRDILQTGAYVVYDGPGRTKYWPDSVLVDLIVEMVHQGFEKQILLGLDMAPRTMWTQYGGGPGLNYLLNVFLKKLRQAELTEAQINLFTVENPANAFAFRLQ